MAEAVQKPERLSTKAKLLDLTKEDDPTATVADLIGQSHPGAIGADEFVPRVSYELRDKGIEWVKVKESYPENTTTWVFCRT